MQALKDRICANLAAHHRLEIDPTGHRRAAVAVLLSPLEDGRPSFALTRRAMTMRRGAGNFALPGGNFEPGDDPVAAALRETHEELGVEVGREAALGLLDDFLTLGGHHVTPVVLWTDAVLTLDPDPQEVHIAWRLPLSDLEHPQAPRAEPHPHGGEPILRMFAGGNWVNPPTAAWLYQFREVALHGRSVRVDKVGQPLWTAR